MWTSFASYQRERAARATAPSLPHHCAASSSPPLLSFSAPLHFSPPLPPRMVAAARLFLSRVRPGGGDDLQAKGDGGLNLPVRSSSNPSAASSPPPPPPPPPLPLLPLPPHPSSTATSRSRPRLAVVAMRFAGEPDIHLFAAFDGHGACGAACSGFARDGLPRLLLLAAEDDTSGGSLLASDLAGAFRAAMVGVNEEMHAAAAVDDSMSGTTAVAALVAGGALHVANVEDSRAVAGVWRDGRVAAEELSWDQTPFRADERARVKACGARVMSVEQVEGVRDPDAEGWLAYEGDPPRVWARDGLYPGTAFTRSLGDLAAEGAGVIADPEVKTVEITPAHLFFAVASDGVFEFLSSQEVVDMTVQNVCPTSPYLAKQILFCTPTRCLMKIPEGWQGRIGL